MTRCGVRKAVELCATKRLVQNRPAIFYVCVAKHYMRVGFVYIMTDHTVPGCKKRNRAI